MLLVLAVFCITRGLTFAGFDGRQEKDEIISTLEGLFPDGDKKNVKHIDKAIKLGFNHPMGPFEMADMVGIDTVYHGIKNMAKVYGERFEPTETMRTLYEEGNLGQKTGKGFFDHTSK